MAKRKTKKQPEVVTKCDNCGKDLGRTCCRTDGSAACAAGDGITVKSCLCGNPPLKLPKFYCCKECSS